MQNASLIIVRDVSGNPVVGAKVEVDWTTGSGWNVGEDVGYTDQNGKVILRTPNIVVIPTGASGKVTVTKGLMVGQSVIGVDIWGNSAGAEVTLTSNSIASISTRLRDTAGEVSSGIKTGVVAVVAVAVSIGILVWGLARLLHR